MRISAISAPPPGAASPDRQPPSPRSSRLLNNFSDQQPCSFGDQASTFLCSSVMATTEHTINDALAAVLRETRRAWRNSTIVRSENTGMLKGSAKRPDILVLEPSVSPVVIGTEVFPGATVEADAIARLGAQVRTTGRLVLSSIAVKTPERLRGKHASRSARRLSHGN